MGADLLRFGNTGETSIHPLGALLAVVAIFLVAILERRYIIAPLLMSMIILPLGQKLVVAGLSLFIFRIILLAGWLRVLGGRSSESNSPRFQFNVLDKAIILWGFTYTITFTL